jgi:hypothetical protein
MLAKSAREGYQARKPHPRPVALRIRSQGDFDLERVAQDPIS